MWPSIISIDPGILCQTNAVLFYYMANHTALVCSVGRQEEMEAIGWDGEPLMAKEFTVTSRIATDGMCEVSASRNQGFSGVRPT